MLQPSCLHNIRSFTIHRKNVNESLHHEFQDDKRPIDQKFGHRRQNFKSNEKPLA